MKLLALLSVFFLISSPSFADEIDDEDKFQAMVNDSLKAMLKCDKSGISSAKMALGLARFMMIEPKASAEEAKVVAAHIDESFDMLKASKSCADYQKTYSKVADVLLKDAAFDLEAELKKPEAAKMLQDFARGMAQQSK